MDFFVLGFLIEDTTHTLYAAGDSVRYGVDIPLLPQMPLSQLCLLRRCKIPSTKQDMSHTCVHRRFFASIKTIFADVLLMSTVMKNGLQRSYNLTERLATLPQHQQKTVANSSKAYIFFNAFLGMMPRSTICSNVVNTFSDGCPSHE